MTPANRSKGDTQMIKLSDTDLRNLKLMAGLDKPTLDYRGRQAGMEKLVAAGLARRIRPDRDILYEITDEGRKAAQ